MTSKTTKKTRSDTRSTKDQRVDTSGTANNPQHCVRPRRKQRHAPGMRVDPVAAGNSPIPCDLAEHLREVSAALPRGLSIIDAIRDQDDVRWVMIRNDESSCLAKRTDFAIDDRQGFQTMKAAGLDLFGRGEAQAVREAVASITQFRDQTVIKKVGWTGPHYTMLDGKPISPNGVAAPPVIFQTDKAKVSSAGDLHSYKKRVLMPLARHPIAEFAVCFGLTGIMMELMGAGGGIGLGLFGSSSTGKSTLGDVLASLWGRPSGSGTVYSYSLNATREGVQKAVPNHQDGLLVLDELGFLGEGRSAGSELFNLVLRLSSGAGRLTARAGATSDRHAPLCYYFSANETFTEVFDGLSRQKQEAAAVRLISIVVKKPLGIFLKRPKRFTTTSSAIRSIKAAIKKYHGTAARAFAQGVCQARANDERTFVKKVNKHIRSFRERAGFDDATPQQQRVIDDVALIAVTGVYARHCNILPKSYNPVESALFCLKKIESAVHPKQTITDRIRNWLASNTYHDLRVRNLPRLTDAQMKKEGAFIANGKKKTVEVQLTTDVFRTMFPDYREIITSAEARHLLVGAGSGSYQTKRTVREGHLPEKVYVFAVPEGFI